MRRRHFLLGGGTTGALLLSRPGGVLGGTLSGGTRAQVATRASRLLPGTFLVHADMHNHSLFSDGAGDPSEAFVSMRDHGLDVAALTDHAVLGGALGTAVSSLCGSQDCRSIQGIDDQTWAATSRYADDANTPDSFVAIRGFEWSSPMLGHMNVWFSDDWIDPERTGGLVGLEGLELLTDEIPFIGPQVGEPLANLVTDSPISGLAMQPFFDWLRTRPGGGLLGSGGGADGIIGFNHPGREPGRFGAFHFDERLLDRVVSLEMFNRDEDYLFEGTDTDDPSPLNQCLNAGWKPGLLGVTDEHGTDWGNPLDKGRGGMWVSDLSRSGVRDAMLRRAFFATRERGLRVDVAASAATGSRVRMGGDLAHDTGPITFEIDIDKGAEWIGKPLRIQLLRPGSFMPEVVREEDVVVPGPDQPVITLTQDLSRADGQWVVVRITDPETGGDGRATGTFVSAGRGIAYASPIHLLPAGSAAAAGGVDAPATAETGASPVAAGATGAEGPVGVLPYTGSETLWLGAGAAVGAAALARMASRRPPGTGHTHDPGHDHH